MFLPSFAAVQHSAVDALLIVDLFHYVLLLCHFKDVFGVKCSRIAVLGMSRGFWSRRGRREGTGQATLLIQVICAFDISWPLATQVGVALYLLAAMG